MTLLQCACVTSPLSCRTPREMLHKKPLHSFLLLVHAPSSRQKLRRTAVTLGLVAFETPRAKQISTGTHPVDADDGRLFRIGGRKT
ncbi:hypothetical protein BJX64DRAFT_269388 [Aspergillus heterothallicus]